MVRTLRRGVARSTGLPEQGGQAGAGRTARSWPLTAGVLKGDVRASRRARTPASLVGRMIRFQRREDAWSVTWRGSCLQAVRPSWCRGRTTDWPAASAGHTPSPLARRIILPVAPRAPTTHSAGEGPSGGPPKVPYGARRRETRLRPTSTPSNWKCGRKWKRAL